MVFRKLIFAFLFVGSISLSPVKAQLELDLWFDGWVSLEDGTAIQGQLSYYSDYTTGVLQIKVGERTYSFDANQIVNFRFYDGQLKADRFFYSLPYSPPGNPNTIMLFFEALYEGQHLSVLSKTEIRTQTRSANTSPYAYRGTYVPSWYNRNRNNSYTIDMPFETLYVVTPDTEIEEYSEPTALDKPNVRFKRANTDLLEKIMHDRNVKIQAFLKENKFDLRRRADMLRTVVYYNELKSGIAAQ